MTRISSITGKEYDANNVMYITDISQVAFYFAYGISDELLDILYDGSRKQCNRLCFIFSKTPKTKIVFDIWNNNRNEKKE